VRSLVQHGADEVVYIKDRRLGHLIVQNNASILVELAQERSPAMFLAAATTYGRTIMPYVSVRLKAGLTADCTGLDIEPESGLLLQTRPAIGGNILATIKTEVARPQMATVRPHSTRILPADNGRTGMITDIRPADRHFRSRVEFVRLERTEAGDTPISEARKVVSGGRGVGKAENMSLIRELAGSLDAGCVAGGSRPRLDFLSASSWAEREDGRAGPIRGGGNLWQHPASGRNADVKAYHRHRFRSGGPDIQSSRSGHCWRSI